MDSAEIASADKALAIIQKSCPTDYWPFVEAFLADPKLNISAAERKAGLPPGAGQRALAHPGVRSTIGAIMSDRRDRYRDIRDKALLILADIAFHDPAEAWDPDGVGVLRLPDMPPSLRLAVSEYEERVSPDGTVTRKVKFHDRVKVLQILLQQFGDPGETVEAQGTTTVVRLRGVETPAAERGPKDP